MVLLTTFLVIYPKNYKQNSNESVQMFYKIVILKNFAKYTRKHLGWNLVLINLKAFSLQLYLKRDSSTVITPFQQSTSDPHHSP